MHSSRSWKGRIFEWHRVGGFYLAGALLRGFGAQEPLPKPEKATQGAFLPLDELVIRANRAFPDGQLRRISFPAKAGAPVVIRKKLPEELHPNGMNNIVLDGATGRILQISDSRRATMNVRWMNLRYPLHIAVWGGIWTRILWVGVGLSPLLLAISGVLIWKNRRFKK